MVEQWKEMTEDGEVKDMEDNAARWRGKHECG